MIINNLFNIKKYLLCHLFDQVNLVNLDHLFLLLHPQVLQNKKNNKISNHIITYTQKTYLQDLEYRLILENQQDRLDQMDPEYINHIIEHYFSDRFYQYTWSPFCAIQKHG